MSTLKLADIVKKNCAPCITSENPIGMRVVENNGYSTGVFAWNIFILVANGRLGLREPDMDPLLKK